jgi:RNA polymerase sigma factor (sigma-70 family)
MSPSPESLHSEDYDLIRAYQAGDREAGAKLLKRHERFLKLQVLQKHGRRRSSETEDHMQLARLGLLRAAKDFDFSLGNSLLTPTYWWVRGELQHYKRKSKVFGLPDALLRVLSRLSKENKFNTLYEALVEARRQNLITDETFTKASFSVSGVQSLDRDEASEKEDGPGRHRSLKDMLASEDPNAEDLLKGIELSAEVQAVLQDMKLNARELAIVRYRLTVDKEDQRTQEELGDMFGVSHQWIQQVEVKLIEKLRKRLARLALV